MNIIITLAGKSIRFKEAGYKKPKFLINLNNKELVLNKVVNMFNKTKDTFFFIINKDQSNIKGLKKYLTKIVNQKHIITIPSHKKGPVYSVLSCEPYINKNEKIIISYCDFFIFWDYKMFLNEVDGFSAAAPAFKGFHPASFGSTYYAYMKVNKKNELIKLKEKQSFTKKRFNEPASTGIYYFKNFNFFLKYAKKLLLQKIQLKEYYVSLLLNLIVKDKIKVKITYVNKFVCLGTPKDLGEFYFWQKYFKEENKNFKKKYIHSDTLNIIPIGGIGKRFKKNGYRTIKPFVMLENNKSIIEKACNSFPNAKNWAFIINRKITKNQRYINKLYSINPNSNIFVLKKNTKGQLETCKKYISSKEFQNKFSNHKIFISSCDYSSIYNERKWKNTLKQNNCDIYIWTTKLNFTKVKNYNAFGYCILNKNNFVKKIIEKKTISNTPEKDHMIIGTFWFKNSNLINEMYNYAKKFNIIINQEYYIANAINIMITKGYKVKIFNIDQWISFGDPFEIEIYNYWKEIFNEKKTYK